MPKIPIKFNISLSWIPALITFLALAVSALCDIGKMSPASHIYSVGDILSVILVLFGLVGFGYIAGRFEERD